MESSRSQRAHIAGFLKEKGINDDQIGAMFQRCKRLEGVETGSVSANWDYLKGIGIQERKLPFVVSRCPKILTLGLDEKLVPTVHCLATLGNKPSDVATAIAKFPNILVHSVEGKLCPLLGFFQALGISEKQAGRLVLLNPRLISYSIETKFSEIVGFFVSMGLDQDGMVGKILTKNPFIMGYSVEGRLRPTMEFLKVIGLSDYDLRKVAIYFSEVLCRDVERNLRPNFAFLQRCGFSDGQIAKLVAGYPSVLIKSVKNCLKPRVNFLVKVMGRDIGEIVDYPEFFRHGLKKSLEARQKMLKEKSISCSLREMLGCSQKKFLLKYGLC